jgi:hypothetical protein
MPLQKIETIDQPRAEADEAGQLEIFEKKSPRRDDFRNRLIWGDNKLVMASLLGEFTRRTSLRTPVPSSSVRAGADCADRIWQHPFSYIQILLDG